MRTCLTSLAVVCVIAVAAAYAADDPRTLLDAAEAAREDGSVLDAARAYGRAAAAAHTASDLDAEADVWEKLEEFLNCQGRPSAAGDEGTHDVPDQVDAVIAVLGELDASRGRSYVSAQALSYALIHSSVATGGQRGMERAAAVLEEGPGKGCATLAGVASVLAERGPDGASDLETALATAESQGWDELTRLLCIERAAQRVAAEDKQGAREFVTRATATIPSGTQGQFVTDFHNLALGRLRGAGSEVLQPVLDLISRGASSGSAGGAGGAAVAPGQRSPVGAAWKKLSKTKPFVRAKRTDGFTVSYSFDKKFKTTVADTPAEHIQSHGGVALWFHGPHVALCLIDPVGNSGMPGANASRNRWRAWYLVARGETWGLTKKGEVKITSK